MENAADLLAKARDSGKEQNAFLLDLANLLGLDEIGLDETIVRKIRSEMEAELATPE